MAVIFNNKNWNEYPHGVILLTLMNLNPNIDN